MPRLLYVLTVVATIHGALTGICSAQPSRFLEDWRWAEFTTEAGLPSDHVYAILETGGGTPWVFTKAGIAWYDGYLWHQVPFPRVPPLKKPLSFYADSRDRIIVVHDTTLFIGDTTGFKESSLSRVIHAAPMQEGRLLLLHEDPNLHQWLDLWDGHRVVPVPTPEAVTAQRGMSLQRTTNGTIWLSAGECLFVWVEGKWQRRFRANSGQTHLECGGLVENGLNCGLVYIFSPYASRGLWEWEKGGELVRSQTSEEVRGVDIATDGTALIAVESGNYRLRYAGNWSTLQLQRLSSCQVEMVTFRKSGDLWLCTDRGLYLVKYSSGLWRFISENAPSHHSEVNDILLAPDSSLWLATGGGLRVYKKDGSVTTIEQVLGRRLYLATGLLEDQHGKIWVCSGSGFPGVFTWDGSRWEKVGVGSPLDRAQIHRMKMDRKGRIWLLGIPGVRHPAPGEEGPGAFVYENGTITRWGVQEGLPSNRVYAFDEGRDGSLWFGTMKGLSKWKMGKWRHWTLKELFSADRVFTLAIDKDAQVWFSDRKGVVGMVNANGDVRRIRTEDGLLSEVVSEIKLDAKGRLWFTTPIGLTAYCNGSWTRFDVTSGIRNAPLWPVLPLENTVYTGSNSGLVVLSLGDIDQSAPQIHLIQPMTSGRAALLRWRALTRWNDIPPERIETRYRLGNQPWSPWSLIHEASLQDLAPGAYVYEVQSTPLFGGDSSSYQTVHGNLAITLPLSQDPRIMVPAAIVFFVLVAVALGVTTHSRRLKQRQLREELRREHEHAERLAEVDKLKSRFFANISHEFRTPLTLVLGPIGQALSDVEDERVRQRLLMAQRNAGKLHGLINQLLDISRVEARMMKLAVSKGDIVSICRRIVQSFQSWAEQKKHILGFETDQEKVVGYFDAGCVEKILNNLISNALKFTPEGGIIKVQISNSKPAPDRIRISVSDTGIGIGAEHLPHIFERFYRVDESHKTEGTGIGLALAKDLVELHHGSITVQSTPGKGTEFTVTIPLGLEHFKDDEIAETPIPEVSDSPILPLPDSFVEEDRPVMPEGMDTEGGHKTIVMVVEDSADVRAYIRDYLVPEFSVLEAQDGKEGLEKARAIVPDLIVSDVMMPHMDGYELCGELKRDERTSHIPVILLTARAGTESKIEGLEIGADDYVTKPFDAKELLTRIRNLIEGRRKLREKFSKAVPLKPGEVTATSMDDAFLRKAIDVVEKCMGDEHFSVEQFSEQMAMSRWQLHRKLQALTNQSANGFVRHMRLLRAHELLLKNAGTISEIAFQTGFGSLTYFTRCFHEQFGFTPSKVRESASNPS